MKKLLTLAVLSFFYSFSQAENIKEAVKNSVLIVSGNFFNSTENLEGGVAKSNYQVTDIEVVSGKPAEYENGMMYMKYHSDKVGYNYRSKAKIDMYIRHNDKTYLLFTFQAPPLAYRTDESSIRRFMNYVDHKITEYLAVADNEGKYDKKDLKAYSEEQFKQWANGIKSQTFYVSDKVSDSNYRKWDKTYGKIKKTSDKNLNNIIENGENPNGYYILGQRRFKYLWATGFLTYGAGFFIAPAVPKQKSYVFSTDNDKFLATFITYGDLNKKPGKIAKKIKKTQSK
jgi:hypothetical protein